MKKKINTCRSVVLEVEKLKIFRREFRKYLRKHDNKCNRLFDNIDRRLGIVGLSALHYDLYDIDQAFTILMGAARAIDKGCSLRKI